jgi:hypothetical protein
LPREVGMRKLAHFWMIPGIQAEQHASPEPIARQTNSHRWRRKRW